MFVVLVRKFQDLFRSPAGILVLGFGSEIPRFVQESCSNLGSWLWFGNSKICSGVLQQSWFLVLVRKFQDLFRSPAAILVLGFGSENSRFVQESCRNLGSWFWFGNSKICSGVLGNLGSCF